MLYRKTPLLLRLTSNIVSDPKMLTSATDYLKLSISERIQLVEDIWDSIAAEASNSVELSQVQKTELHRRADAHCADPSTAIPWQQTRSKLFPGKL